MNIRSILFSCCTLCKRNIEFSVLPAILMLAIPGYGQSLIHQDTLTLNKSGFKDSVSIKKMIDDVYAFKEQDPHDAIKLCTYAYNRASDLKNITLQAGALNVIGAAYEDLGNYQSALKQHYLALRLFEKANNAYGMAMVKSNIGRVYMQTGKLKDAITYLSKAEEGAKQTGQDRILLYVYSNLANVYT